MYAGTVIGGEKSTCSGAAVDADRGSCGILTEGVFTPGGTFDGTLVYEPDQTCVVTGEDGALKITF